MFLMSEQQNELETFVTEYVDYLAASFEELWAKVPLDPKKLEAFSVLGAMLARQVTLAIQLAKSPGTWNGHSAPLFLRAQTDLQITLAWMLGDLPDRSRQYVLHGLGEEKLLLEQYRNELQENPEEENRDQIQQIIDAKTGWINSQRHEWLVEVNLGHWAHLDTRKMAQEANCESLYKFAYKPFSQAAHSMWPHVSVYNSKHCENSLHRNHLVPALTEAPLDVDYVYRSCKYVHRSYRVVKEKFGIVTDNIEPLDWWGVYFTEKQSEENVNAESHRSGDS
jgi:hypothetical protein